MVSHVDLIGALAYRTRQELNKNETFKANLVKYYKYVTTAIDPKTGNFNLSYFAGTRNELLITFDTLGYNEITALKIFPCIVSYQDVVETHGVGKDGLVQFDFDLVIAGVVDSSYTTEQRSRTVHKYLLEPIYDEFIRQIKRCGWFHIPMQGLDYTRIKAFTSGQSEHKITRFQYGWYADSIQLIDFRPQLRKDLCEDDQKTIELEAELLTRDL